MKGKNKSYLYVLIGTIVFLVILTMINQPEQRWVPTWSSLDKEPFGGYVTHDLMRDIFPGREVRSEYRSLFEILKEDSARTGSWLIVTNQLALSETDLNALKQHLQNGNDVLIAAHAFSGMLADSLNLSLKSSGADSYSVEETRDAVMGEATTALRFTIPGYPEDEFEINREASSAYFIEDSGEFATLAVNESGEDVLRKYTLGEGSLYLSSNPLLLTNFYMLDSSSHRFSVGLLSLLPANREVTHVEFYAVGRMEAQTPLRFILSHSTLKTAFWITLMGILLFIIFEARRRQRIIPVVAPPVNSSLEFVQTLGQLYYTSGEDHLNLARKRMNYFLEHVRRKYFLVTNELDDAFIEDLSRKSGKDRNKIERLVNLLNRIKNGQITQVEFLKMEIWLNDFYGIKKSGKDKNK